MKRIIITATIAVLGIAVLVSPCSATEEQAKRNASAALLAQTSLGYQAKGLASAFLKKDTLLETKVELFSGREYIFIAAGCNDAYDVDVVILNSEASIVFDYDIEISKIAVVKFFPPYTGSYTVHVLLSRGADDGAHVFMLVGVK